MFNKVYILSFFILSLLIPQDWNYSADVAEIKKKNGEEIKQFDGNVVISREDLQLKTNRAIQYVDKNEIHLYGDISMIDKETTINCKNLIYYINQESCLAYNDVVLNQKNRTIYCDTLRYWDKKDSLKSIGDITIIQNNQKRKVKAQEMYMFKPDSLNLIFQLTESAEVFNMIETKVSKDSPTMLFEDKLKGKKIEIIIQEDTLRNVNIYGMAIADYHVIKDSLLMGVNNVSGDSIIIDFNNDELTRMRVSGGGLGEFIPEKGNSRVDSIVYYNAEYIDYVINLQKSILKKNAQVDYGETMIKSGNIVVDWDTNMLDADQAHNVYPVVSKKGESPMMGESMRFDLINKKGVIKKGKTNFDDGFYQGKIIQRQEPDILHMFNSKYTSCSLDHPHYYFGSKKMKMIQGDKMVARPIILYIADFPVIGFPFAVLPNKGGGRRTGWIMPSFGNSESRGNFIQNLGYYWAPNDLADLKFLISLYDLKGFNLKSYFRYKKRYRYDGSIRSTLKRDLVEEEDIAYIFTENSIQDWDIHWIHNQTFDPYQRLNIDLTYITSNNFYQSENLGFDLETRLKQNIESSMNYTKNWPNQKNSLTLYLSESYDMLTFDESAQISPVYYKTRTLPKATFRHNSTRLFGDGNHWYNNIFSSMSSIITGNQKIGFYAQNFEQFDEGEEFIDSNDNGELDDGESFFDNKIDTTEYNSGVVHSFNFSFSDKIFRWFSITPSINLKESWIFRYKEHDIDNDGNFIDTYNYNESFKRRLSGSLSMSLATKLYGIIPLKIGRFNSLRHILSPSISFNYLPDLSNSSSLFQISPSGEIKDYFTGSLVGGTSTSTSRRYFLTLRNDFQIKYQDIKTNNYLKANFLNWTLSTSYNPEQELQWSNINSIIQANIPELFNIDIAMTHDLYKQEYNLESESYTAINKFEPFPRLTYISASTDIGLSGNKFNYNSSQDTLVNMADTLDFDEKINLAQSIDSYEPIIESGKVWDTGLRLRYALQSYSEGNQIRWDKTFWINTDITINLSSNWKMTYSARFDLDNNEIVNHSIYLFRPLHCWEFSFKWWPSGNNKGFMLNIYVKNPDLRDIRVKSTGGSFFGL